jgi:hypothetical protein
MYNNDSSTLTAANDTTAAAFIARRVRDPAAAADPHPYRQHAWTLNQSKMTNEDSWRANSPDNYYVEPLDISKSNNFISWIPVRNFISVRHDKKEDELHPYRHEAWNEANHNATHKVDYNASTPLAYSVEPMDIPETPAKGEKADVKNFLARANIKNNADYNKWKKGQNEEIDSKKLTPMSLKE